MASALNLCIWLTADCQRREDSCAKAITNRASTDGKQVALPNWLCGDGSPCWKPGGRRELEFDIDFCDALVHDLHDVGEDLDEVPKLAEVEDVPGWAVGWIKLSLLVPNESDLQARSQPNVALISIEGHEPGTPCSVVAGSSSATA